jgi:hypothetical protein
MTLFLDHPLVASRYFFPQPCRFADPFFVDCEDARLGCFLRCNHPGAPIIVHFHGNGETVADYLPEFANEIDAMGFNLLLTEYRGYGMSTGEPFLGRMLDDVEHVVRAVGLPPRQFIFFGRSVGSLFAIHAVSRFPEAGGLIIESGIADLLERLLLRVHPAELGVTVAEIEEEIGRRLNHRRTLSAYGGPLLVMHTRCDGLIDVSHAERLAAWAEGPVTLKIFERGDHNSIFEINRREYYEVIFQFMAEIRRAPSGAMQEVAD